MEANIEFSPKSSYFRMALSTMNTKRILVIAGSDSSGGAGLEADQKVIAAHGCFAMTATTALTAQNTQGVIDVHKIPPDFLRKQIDACIEDVGVDVIKMGMLASEGTIEVVTDALHRHGLPRTVVDPVMVATTGHQLLPPEAVKVMIEKLLPVTTILTPNIPEAQLLLQEAERPAADIKKVDDLITIAKALQLLGPEYVLLKGGHLPLSKEKIVNSNDAEQHVVIDVLVGPHETHVFNTDFIRSKNTHGTGCSLASAIACGLADGMVMARAVKSASRYVEAGIKTSTSLGQGNGPINHFHSSYHLPFAPGRFVEYLLERDDVQAPWKDYTEHIFLKKLADGTLPTKAFQYYLIQDYLFLIQFSRANALAAYKAKTMKDINMSAAIVGHLNHETNLHLDYCKEFGLSKEEVENHQESQACTAYTRYVLEVGQSEDWLALQVALAPCLLGYGMIARRIYNDPMTLREGNMYWKWIETYVADDYAQAVEIGSDLLERHAINQSPSRIEELVKIFIHATKMETGFWDMAS